MYEEAFFALLNATHRARPSENLALSGGCAMNSVANGKVYLHTPFRRMYLPAAAGDAGGAIGAAAVVAAKLADGKAEKLTTEKLKESANLPTSNYQLLSRRGLDSAFLGPEFSDAEIEQLLRERGLREGRNPEFQHLSVSVFSVSTELTTRTAAAIAEGRVVGWFQGRLEWGPRALGNRSILGDPRRADMKDILNAKIKRRESFRPFAPSILREAVGEWFEQEDDVPFMMQVFQIREEKRSQIPAVCHADGSGRLQTVHQETNPLYHQLISDFRSLTSRAFGSQHQLQRERTGRLPPGRSPRLLSPHQNGCLSVRQFPY